MRKWVSLIIGLFLMIGITSLYSETSVLIDFSLLKANGDGIDPAQSKEIATIPYNEHNYKEHMPTIVDYSGIAGSNFTEEEVKQMNVSLAPANWEVKLNSSANKVEFSKDSMCIEWHTKYQRALKDDDATGDAGSNPEGFSILGVRIHFPEHPFNCWALIKPPFEIPAYEDKLTDELGNDLSEEDKKAGQGQRFVNGYGVIKNVGVIKSITMTVYGLQFNNSISLLMKDQDNETTEYMFPEYLNFDGWRKITWSNPNYVNRVANRDLYIVPLYPESEPYVKIAGFRVYRQGDQVGGDFVTYIKDVKVTYDLAVVKRDEPIQHEEAWGILQARTLEAKKREYSKLGQSQILRYMERLKMDKSTQ